MWRMRRGSNSRAVLAPDSTVFEAGPLVHSGTHPSFLEEKRGFGPLCRIPATTAFPMRAIRPLWHFSVNIKEGWRKARDSDPRPRGCLDTRVQTRRNRPLCQPSGGCWYREQKSNLRRSRFQRDALPSELSRQGEWRPEGKSNPRLPPRQGGTLATELSELRRW